jgi:uncharacterized membrane protein (DUF373 family)
MLNIAKTIDFKSLVGDYFSVVVAGVIFLSIIIFKLPFYTAITLMLEFIVILEVVRMIMDFVKNKRIQLRFVIDIFIVFLTRDVIIQVTQPQINQDKILFLLLVIFIFFIFRLMTLYLGPTAILKNNNIKEEIE